MLPAPPEPLDDRVAERHPVFRGLLELLLVPGPTVVVLEDLHWADEHTVGVAALASGCAFRGDLVAHDLPPERAAYTLEVETDGVRTVWKYTSQRPQDSKGLRPCLATALGNPDTPRAGPRRSHGRCRRDCLT